MKVTKGTILHAVDGGSNVVMDRDVDMYVDGKYMIGDHIYRVVIITGSRVYIRSVKASIPQ